MTLARPVLRRKQRVHVCRWCRHGWTFDQPARVVRRIEGGVTPTLEQDAYIVRHADGEVLCEPAEHLSREAVSYPGLSWLEVLAARGLEIPRAYQALDVPVFPNPYVRM